MKFEEKDGGEEGTGEGRRGEMSFVPISSLLIG